MQAPEQRCGEHVEFTNASTADGGAEIWRFELPRAVEPKWPAKRRLESPVTHLFTDLYRECRLGAPSGFKRASEGLHLGNLTLLGEMGLSREVLKAS